ncbi:MAG: carboxypeptidase-like regulatory domain-containing protein, partial [Bacteroidota bacterium]
MKKLFLSVLFLFGIYTVTVAQGIVRGKITDASGETQIGVTIVVKSNPSIGTVTDLDGNYSLNLKDSTTQTLVVTSIGYELMEEVVRAKKGEVIIKNFILKSAAHEMKEIEVTAKGNHAKDSYIESMKKSSSVTLDYISSETIKKTGDANVTAAVARVSGVSTNGSFITVRGIGDRYIKTAINGLRIPTLDPFTNNIKLDLFPASLVDNVIITKTESPDLPGDFAGAYISVETKDYPEQLAVNIETSVGYNNQTTFKDIVSSQQSSTDWLGFDNNFRDHNHDSFVPTIKQPTDYQQFVALGLGAYYSSLGVTNENWNANSDVYYRLGLIQLGLLSPAQIDD